MKRLFSLVVCAASINASEITIPCVTTKIQRDAIFASEKLGEIDVFRNKKGFQVLHNGKMHKVKSYMTDPLLKSLPANKLNTFLDNGYIAVKLLNNGEFKLDAKGRLKGGGPILAGIAYWGVKAVGYGVPAAAAGGAIVAAGAAIVPALAVGGAGGALGGTVAGTTTAINIAITSALPAAGTASAGIVGSAVVGAVGAETASIAAAGAITGAGGVAGYVATVEVTATGLAALAMMVPFI